MLKKQAFKKLLSSSAFCVTLFFTNTANADHKNNKSLPSDHAPISVMGDHMHKTNEIMLSYRRANMGMKGLKDGDSSITPSSVVAATGNYQYMMTPIEMDMSMDMFGAMYAPNNDLILMLMGHYMRKDMKMLARSGTTSKMRSSGFGDTKISALYRIFHESCQCGANSNLHANIGLSLPTGSIDEKGFRMGSIGNLPYAMQLGSGTFDPILGLTYSARNSAISWGAQAKTVLRFGKNAEGYRLGNEYEAKGWLAKDLNDYISTSISLAASHKEDIEGRDGSTFGLRNAVPTFDPQNYGGQKIELGFGVNLLNQKGLFKNHRLAVEYNIPIYENLNGPQMSQNHTLWLGWQYAF